MKANLLLAVFAWIAMAIQSPAQSRRVSVDLDDREKMAEIRSWAETIGQETSPEEFSKFWREFEITGRSVPEIYEMPEMEEALIRALFNQNRRPLNEINVHNAGASDPSQNAARKLFQRYQNDPRRLDFPGTVGGSDKEIAYVRAWFLRNEPELVERAGVDRAEAIQMVREAIAEQEVDPDFDPRNLQIVLPDDAMNPGTPPAEGAGTAGDSGGLSEASGSRNLADSAANEGLAAAARGSDLQVDDQGDGKQQIDSGPASVGLWGWPAASVGIGVVGLGIAVVFWRALRRRGKNGAGNDGEAARD